MRKDLAIKRRQFLGSAVAATATGALLGVTSDGAEPIQVAPSAPQTRQGQTVGPDNQVGGPFAEALVQIKKWLADTTARSRIDYHGGLRLHTPCVNGGYKGIWPDDFLYPLLVDPSLLDRAMLQRAVEFITASVVGLSQVPDRIEADGMPVMQPGATDGPGNGPRMPLHLPAAWVRLLDCARGMGAEIPRKADWARLIERSFEKVPFACGLAYVDPQQPGVGFGFHDPSAITGFELMSSLVLYRGLQRAAALFADVIAPSLKQRWLAQADGIRDNLHRLWSDADGAYLAGSKHCRQVNVWANGLAYWLADPEKQRRIVAWYKANKQKIFLRGCTRQIAEEGGWQRELIKIPPGSYTNGGYWSTGTGFVLPAIAHQDRDFAGELVGQMLANMEKSSYAEWIDADGRGLGASGFLAGIAMPGLALRSIMEEQPLLAYF